MVATIQRIDFPEIFVGFVAPIGTDIGECVNVFRKYFDDENYQVIELKVTDIFKILSQYLQPKQPLVQTPLMQRYMSHIAYGDYVRSVLEDDAALAALTIPRIMRRRLRATKGGTSAPERKVYLIHQFKRPEEIELFRSVYGRLFFQVSIYSRRGARVSFLSKRFAQDASSGNAEPYRGNAEELVQKDQNEISELHGQRVSSVFHDGDVILNIDSTDETVTRQIHRFCDLLFGSNRISPTKIEYGMFAVRAAAVRSLDLSRQVGAAIFSSAGEIIAMGSNEVPKADGGTYWSDEKFDDRDYKRGYDSNENRKKELLRQLIELIGAPLSYDDIISRKEVLDSQFMDALEYGRVIHAEMSAICDAARLGRSLRDATLFCTTFPCHMCAKHIIAVGIRRVVFLEPYPKSLAGDLHGDSICIEGADRGKYEGFPAVDFTHFAGISPRRYREIFDRTKRKNEIGVFQNWADNVKRPIIDIKFPFYSRLEQSIVEGTVQAYLTKIRANQDIFDTG
jgi:deoxycytidylate deaminase